MAKPDKVATETSKTGVAVIVDRVGKQYRRFAHAHRMLTLKSAILSRNIFDVLAPGEIFTALDDVSLTIQHGETLGVIGGNGAGKSTLLKIIAGTTKPTSGHVEVDGQVSALIELGAGFHPEISGRENVFINGIMLGLSRAEIAASFDDIVAFAELEEFIDAPVKTYSSGMYMRLGFSVAIHVNPDVLLIDEVLAVGDEAFVHKCLDKIAEFKRRGKTILLVTHSLESVRRLCDRAMWICDGRVMQIGDPPRVIGAYLSWVAEKEEEDLAAGYERRAAAAATTSDDGPLPADVIGADAPAGAATDAAADGETKSAPYETGRWGSRQVVIESTRLLNAQGEQHYVFACGDPMTIELQLAAPKPVDDFVVGIGIFNVDGVTVYGTNTDIERFEAAELGSSSTVRIEIPQLNLVEGTYYLDIAVHRRDGSAYDYHRGLVTFRTTSPVPEVGIVHLRHRWSFAGDISWKKTGGIDQDTTSEGGT